MPRLVSLLILALFLALRAEAAGFARGADLGWLSLLESQGVSWRDSEGKPGEPLDILQAQGVDSVRLRVFVNPPASGYADGYPLGFCDKASVVAMARRAQARGLRVMIDFHYSDTWADPAHQTKPAAWNTHAFSQLLDDVSAHTRDVLQALVEAGVRPEWVQVGNEIGSGLLWPEGRYDQFPQLTQLVNRGYEAVKAVCPEARVIVHLASGDNSDTLTWWLDRFFANGGKCDAIGLSWYPYWSDSNHATSLPDLQASLRILLARYDRDLLLCEVGAPADNPVEGFNLVRRAIEAMQSLPAGRGLGVFYWEPEATRALTQGYALGACVGEGREARFTPVIGAFALLPPQGRLVNLSARALVLTGDNVLIAGFALGGTGEKRILVRGVGPTLASDFGLSTSLTRPVLALFDARSLSLFENEGWADSSVLRAAFDQVGAFRYTPGSSDAALLATLPVSRYTAQVFGAQARTGIALAELYDADSQPSTAWLSNLSARARVGTGNDVLIAGFSVTGGPVTVLLRAIGPGLNAYGLAGLAQPQLTLHDSTGAELLRVTAWQGEPGLAAASTRVGAFPVPATSADAMLLLTLHPGTYTAKISTMTSTPGVALAELYQLGAP